VIQWLVNRYDKRAQTSGYRLESSSILMKKVCFEKKLSSNIFTFFKYQLGIVESFFLEHKNGINTFTF
jgi:hypothetical protein